MDSYTYIFVSAVPSGREFYSLIVHSDSIYSVISILSQFHHLSFSLVFLLLLLYDVCGMVMSDLSSLSFFEHALFMSFVICLFSKINCLSLTVSLCVRVSICFYYFYCPSLVWHIAFQRRLD